jgi:hypothetical protein
MKVGVVIFVILSALLTGCASLSDGELRATPYSVKRISSSDELQAGLNLMPTKFGNFVSVFSGNAYTSATSAYAYTMIAGFEECAKNKMYGIVSNPKDYSTSSTYTDVHSSTYYLTNSYGGITPITSVYSTPVTATRPAYMSTIDCKKQYHLAKGDLDAEPLSRDLVTPYTKDFKGGVIVTKTIDPIPFLPQDVIISVGSKRVENLNELQDALDNASTKSRVPIKIIRKNAITQITLPIEDHTQALIDNEKASYELLCKEIRNNYRSKLDDALGDGERADWYTFNQEVLAACDTIGKFLGEPLPK